MKELPAVFGELKVQNVRQKSSNEWSSSCPKCGGRDRFIYLTNASGNNKNYAFCRKCGYNYIPGKNRQFKPNPYRQIATKIVQREQIVEFNEKKDWLYWHNHLGQYRVYWYDRGVDEGTIDYYKLGFCDDYFGLGPALTIPVFNFKWECVQTYFRLFNPDQKGKYRQTADLPPAVFYTDMDYPDYKKVFWVEGQIKAMVVYDMMLKQEDSERYDSLFYDTMVIGMPSAEPSDDMILELKQAEMIYLSLDPDTYKTPIHERLIRRIKKLLPNVIIKDVCFSDKIDDLIIGGIIDIHIFSKVFMLAATM